MVAESLDRELRNVRITPASFYALAALSESFYYSLLCYQEKIVENGLPATIDFANTDMNDVLGKAESILSAHSTWHDIDTVPYC